MACLLAVSAARTYKETTHVEDDLTSDSDGGSIPPTSTNFIGFYGVELLPRKPLEGG